MFGMAQHSFASKGSGADKAAVAKAQIDSLIVAPGATMPDAVGIGRQP